MLMTRSYTPQCINALLWFAEREPVGWFDKTAPNHSMRKALVRRGLIEEVPDTRFARLQKFRLTDEGRLALREGRPNV